MISFGAAIKCQWVEILYHNVISHLIAGEGDRGGSDDKSASWKRN